jgi:hypothetical protein
MTTSTTLRSLVVLSSLVVATAAAAHSPCDDRAIPDGPLPAGFSQRDFGIVPRACPRTEVGLGVDGRAIVESESFYGNLKGGLRLDGSVQPFPQLELFLTTEPLVYQQVIQSFRASYVGFGDTSVGAKLLAFARQRFALSVVARADLPTSIGYYGNSFPVGVESGMLLLVEPIDDIRLHGGLMGGARWALTKAGADARSAIIANAGFDVVVLPWLGFVLDLNGQALERADLDHLSWGIGARFAFLDDVGLEVGANVPFAGVERNLAAFVLRASYRFE